MAAASAVAFGVIAVGFVIDVATGRDLSVFLIYVLGVALAASGVGVRAGIIAAVASALSVLGDGLLNDVHPLVAMLNGVTAFAILGALVLALDRISKTQHRD